MHIAVVTKAAEPCRNGKNGIVDNKETVSNRAPVGSSFVDATVPTTGCQETSVAELETMLGDTYQGTFPDGLESKATHDQAIELQQVKEIAAAKIRDTFSE